MMLFLLILPIGSSLRKASLLASGGQSTEYSEEKEWRLESLAAEVSPGVPQRLSMDMEYYLPSDRSQSGNRP